MAPQKEDPFNQHFQEQLEAVFVDGEEEWILEKILDHKLVGRENNIAKSIASVKPDIVLSMKTGSVKQM